MFLLTFACADIMNVSWAKITLKLIWSLRFFCMFRVWRNINWILFVSPIARWSEMIALYAGKVSNYLDIMQILQCIS